MDFKSFNTLAERVNREHLFRMFGVKPNPSSIGIDFIDHKRKIAIELKGAVAENGLDVCDMSFKIGVNQIYDYPKMLDGYRLFWVFMPFEMKSSIYEVSRGEIAEVIGRRDILIFDWDYIHTFTAFDDNIYDRHGSGEYEALFRVLGMDNFCGKRSVRNDVDVHVNMFGLSSGSVKKFLRVKREDLYIGHRNRVEIQNGDSMIYMDRGRCEELFECYLQGPYEVETPRQMTLDELVS